MGMLVDGEWKDVWYDTSGTGGRFERSKAAFRNRISRDGSTPHPAEPGRYHLYVSFACPWAHRTLIVRRLKRLEEAVSVSVVDPYMGPDGWVFSDGPGCVPDTVNGFQYLRDIYTAAQRDYTGRVTVPVLWDKVAGTIVSNESAEIVRMLNSELDAFGNADVDFYPEPLREEIDSVNAMVYEHVNDGVYRCGFATSQSAYEAAFDALFLALFQLDKRLADRRYLMGDRITEADWRLFTTLYRFDPVYNGHFKCNLRRIADYANLSGYLRDLYQVPGVAATCHLDHVKEHYYRSHATINPSGIVPKGPEMDLEAPHGRDALGAALPW